MSKTALVTGAGGFLGNHMVTRLKEEGYWVRGVDIVYPAHSDSVADQFYISDLRIRTAANASLSRIGGFDELYHFAASMGGMDYIDDYAAVILQDNTRIDLNIFDCAADKVDKLFFASSACVYRDMDYDDAPLREVDAYPAMPDSEYGWEKLYAERVLQQHARNGVYQARIGRLENTYGPLCAYSGGREKAPAAICRKVARAPYTRGTIALYGGGTRMRCFTHVGDTLRAIRMLMHSSEYRPVNIGPDNEIAIHELARMVIDIAGKDIDIVDVPGPLGVRRRHLDHTRAHALGWGPAVTLHDGMSELYHWVNERV